MDQLRLPALRMDQDVPDEKADIENGVSVMDCIQVIETHVAVITDTDILGREITEDELPGESAHLGNEPVQNMVPVIAQTMEQVLLIASLLLVSSDRS